MLSYYIQGDCTQWAQRAGLLKIPEEIEVLKYAEQFIWKPGNSESSFENP